MDSLFCSLQDVFLFLFPASTPFTKVFHRENPYRKSNIELESPLSATLWYITRHMTWKFHLKSRLQQSSQQLLIKTVRAGVRPNQCPFITKPAADYLAPEQGLNEHQSPERCDNFDPTALPTTAAAAVLTRHHLMAMQLSSDCVWYVECSGILPQSLQAVC